MSYYTEPQPFQLFLNNVATMEPVSLKESIIYKLLTRVFSLYIVVAVTLTGVHLGVKYSQEKNLILQDVEAFQKTFEPVLTKILKNSKGEERQLLFEGITQNPHILGVTIKNAKGEIAGMRGLVLNSQEKLIFIDQKENQQQEVSFRGSLYQYHFPLWEQAQGSSKKIGEVIFYSSTSVIWQRIQVDVMVLLVNAVIKTLALWIIFWGIAKILWLHPLRGFIKNMDRIATPEHLLPYSVELKIKGRHEFKILEEHFNSMTKRLGREWHNLNEIIEEKKRLEQIVEEHTKELQLAHDENIRTSEVIEHQNQIFHLLLIASTAMQRSKDLESSFKFILDQLSQLFENSAFGIILNGVRPGMIDWIAFQGIPESEQKIIIENEDKLIAPGIESFMSNLTEHSDSETIPPDNTFNNWIVFPLLGCEYVPIGKLLIKGPVLDERAVEVLVIFLDQLAVIAENKILTRRLEEMANTDGLTGAFNRTYFDKELERAIAHAEQYNLEYSVILIDINGLKRVNDIFGHQTGDYFIIAVAEVLKKICRQTDVLCRLGGDEFVVLCHTTSIRKAENILKRLREEENRLKLTCYYHDGTPEDIPIRMSCGLASSTEISPKEVLKIADRRMYVDKEKYYAIKERYR
ncbi:diguanylate cyclase [Deltaproteobacteria bacterium TL4]